MESKIVIYNETKIDGYSIFEDGRVFSHKRKIFLKPRRHSGGYLMFTLWSPKQIDCFVHRLVSCAFIDNPYNKRCINHIDGDKTNNHKSNLEWVTDSENQAHAFRIGLNSTAGEKSHRAKLNNEQVLLIRNSSEKTKQLSILYKVSKTTIRSIRANKAWTHI